MAESKTAGQKLKEKLLVNDIILIAAVVILLGFLSYFIYKPSDSEQIAVMYNNSIYGVYSINDNADTVIADSGVVLRIFDGKAFISHSECPDKICINSKPITKNSSDGASIICLPAKVAIIKISSISNLEVDAVAG